MAYIAQKVINGYGPYLYLQETIPNGKGGYVSRHLAYVGKLGADAEPGGSIEVPANAETGWRGGRVAVPAMTDAIRDRLRPTATARLELQPYLTRYRLTSERRRYDRAAVARLPENRRGVYAIWAETGRRGAIALYVGKSATDVRGRLLEHLDGDSDNPELARRMKRDRAGLRFSVAYPASDAEAAQLEAAAIRAWQPAGNKNNR